MGPPGGRTYTARPANAAEAQERRLERFQKSGHAPGLMAVPEEECNLVFPMTLDLRLPAPGQKTRIEEPGLVP